MWELFDQLYAAAFEREHAVMMMAGQLAPVMEVENAVSLGRIARGLIQLHHEFLDDLEAIAIKHRLPRPSQEIKCPKCDDPECPGAWLALQKAVANSPNASLVIVQFYK